MSRRSLPLLLVLSGVWGAPGMARAETLPANEQPTKQLARIDTLSQGAIEGIDTALHNYGGLSGFVEDYSTAARGILESLIAEWEIHDQIGRCAQGVSDERLNNVMKLLTEAEATNARFVKHTNSELAALASAENALRFRKRQISLYEDLQGGLKKDKEVLAQILQISRQ